MLEILNNFLSFMPFVAIYYAVLVPTKSYKAYKQFKANPNISIELPPELKNRINNKEKSVIKKENLNRYFLNFSKTIEEKMPKKKI